MSKKKLSTAQSVGFLSLASLGFVGFTFSDYIVGWLPKDQIPKSLPVVATAQAQTATQSQTLVSPKKNIERVPPNFVQPPDYNDILLAAKMYHQAVDSSETLSWIKAQKSVRVVRERARLAKYEAEEAKYEKEKAEYLAQKEAFAKPNVAENLIFASTGSPQHLFNSDYDGEKTPHEYSVIKVLSYSPANARESAYANLEIDGDIYRHVQTGQVVAGYSVQQLNDQTRCLSLFNSNNPSDLRQKTVCYN